MRRLHFYLDLPDDKAAEFEGCVAMIVPVRKSEVPLLGMWLNTVDDFLRFVRKSISTMGQIIEGKPDETGKIADTLAMLQEPSETAAGLHDETRQLIGRAIFVTPGAPSKETLQ